MSWTPDQNTFFDALADVEEFDETPVWDDLKGIMWVSNKYFSQEWIDSEVIRLGITKPKVVVVDLESLTFDDYPDDLDEYLAMVEERIAREGN